MASVRVLYVDDEPDIRDVVEISLGLDPAFAVRSFGSGADAIAATAEWTPDLVLLDVVMPGMDGPTTLARLRDRPQTAKVPVVFVTARAQAGEIDKLHSLGAAGVISKPFDPMTLPAVLRRYAPAAETRIAVLRDTFLARARADAAVLAGLRRDLTQDRNPPAVLDRIETIVHDLAEAAAIYGFHRMSLDAGALDDALGAKASDPATMDIERALDDLLADIERESAPPAHA